MHIKQLSFYIQFPTYDYLYVCPLHKVGKLLNQLKPMEWVWAGPSGVLITNFKYPFLHLTTTIDLCSKLHISPQFLVFELCYGDLLFASDIDR